MVDPLASVTSLAELRKAVENFHGCPLRTPQTRTVFADGNPAARIMLIGEAPGAEEDRLGKPFVGRSGKLLDQMLEAIGLSRTGEGDRAAYITNTTFWRPPENRTPTPAETASCRPFLLRHIELLNPALILLVGGTAAKTVLQTDTGITKLRKQFHAIQTPHGSYLALPTFHPAYLLRNPPAKKDAWEDLKLLHARATQLGLNLPPHR